MSFSGYITSQFGAFKKSGTTISRANSKTELWFSRVLTLLSTGFLFYIIRSAWQLREILPFETFAIILITFIPVFFFIFRFKNGFSFKWLAKWLIKYLLMVIYLLILYMSMSYLVYLIIFQIDVYLNQIQVVTGIPIFLTGFIFFIYLLEILRQKNDETQKIKKSFWIYPGAFFFLATSIAGICILLSAFGLI